MSTEILPAGPPSEPPVQPPVEPETAAPPTKKRRGWLIALIVLGVLVVLGIIAFIVAESFAKDYARDYVRGKIVDVLQLPADAEVDVDLGAGSIILQALAGRIETVDVDVPDATFGALTGTLSLHGEGVPLDETAPVDTLRVDFAIGADDLAALSEDPSTAPTFAFEGDQVALGSEFELFGAVIPIGLTLDPSAADGALVLTPTSITIGEQTFESGSEDGSFLGQIASALLQPQTLCIAGSVPQALVLDDAAIDGDELVLTFRGDGAALGGPELATPGTCPAA
ncbi:DUF2993 domain-containing protein [Pseudolysinimonas sp.]|jgi:hypothetical protein|uniref:DUF2993 domain-containing protein n=1 Tax=Pseudolysinimonas sp. TaxID=2680009 RepID=UPI003784943F